MLSYCRPEKAALTSAKSQLPSSQSRERHTVVFTSRIPPRFQIPSHPVCEEHISWEDGVRCWAVTQSHAGWAVWNRQFWAERSAHHGKGGQDTTLQGISILLDREVNHWQRRSLGYPTTVTALNGAVQMDQQKLFNNYFPEQFLLHHTFYPQRAADTDTSSAAVISGTLQASSGLWWFVSTPPPGLSEAFWLHWGSPTVSMQASP